MKYAPLIATYLTVFLIACGVTAYYKWLPQFIIITLIVCAGMAALLGIMTFWIMVLGS
jgi:hypothetical protein